MACTTLSRLILLTMGLVGCVFAGGLAIAQTSAFGPCVEITKTLRFGSNDATTAGQVSALQRLLETTGDFTYGQITGYFGPATETAVKRFQCREGIVCAGDADSTGYGVVGPRTRDALNRACAGSTGSGTIQCTQRAKQCPDGSWTYPSGANCMFVCPDDPVVLGLGGSISGPNLLSVGQIGTWTIRPIDDATYDIDWGDSTSSGFSTSYSHAHSYAQLGGYLIKATTKKPDGATIEDTTLVVVTDAHIGTTPGQPTSQCFNGAPKICSNGSILYPTGPLCTYASCSGSDALCTTEYVPVCGSKCGPQTTSTCVPTTYSNLCRMNAAGATFLHDGVCRESDGSLVPIVDLVASPSTLRAGQAVTLSWQPPRFTTSSMSCTLYANGTQIGPVFTTQTSHTHSPSVNTTYRITCVGVTPETYSDTVYVSVTP